MPNDTTNRLTLRGSNVEVARFRDENKSYELDDAGVRLPLSFETLVPTPPEMLGDNSIQDGEMPSWYSWRVENWGTKWDAYDCMDWVNPAPEGRSPTEEDRLNWLHLNWNMETPNVLGFYTAWSPPVPWLLAVSEKYELKFMLEYADEGGGFVGYVIVIDGVIEKQEDLPWDSLDGKALRMSLGNYDYEDMEEV